MEFHELAGQYPLMPEDELALLAEDMRAHGYDGRFPVVLYEGRVLDGRNRWLAAARAGVEPVCVELPAGADPRAFVERANEHRRHLTREWLERRRRERAARAARLRAEGMSLRAIAEAEGVSEVQVRRDLAEATPAAPAGPQGVLVQGRDGKKRPARARKPDPEAEVRELHAQGLGVREVARRLGLDKSKVRRILDRLGLKCETETETLPHSDVACPPTGCGAGRATAPGGAVDPEGGPAAARRGDGGSSRPPAADAWGIPVQPHAAEAFRAVPRFRELIAAIRHAQRLFNEVANLEGGRFLTLPAVSSYRRGRPDGDGGHEDRFVHEGLETALRQVRAAVPTHTVCPYRYVEAPHPEDCRTCLGLNWTPPLSRSIPEAAVAAAKRAFGV